MCLGGNIMKKLLFLSLLVVGSLTYAGTAGHDDGLDLGVPSLPEPCTITTECNSLSPVGRGICLLKGVGQGCISAVCGIACAGMYLTLAEREQVTLRSKLFSTGLVLGALVVGTDSLMKSARNLSTAMAD